jgi:Yip1 domain
MAANPSVSTQLPQEPARLSEGQRLGYIFFAPSRVFADLRRNASWWAPFLIVAVVSLLFFCVVDRKVGFPKVVENLIRLHPKQADRIDHLPADQRDKTMAQRATITKIVSYAVPVITLVLYAVFAGVLFVTLKFVVSADVKYKTLFAVVVYSRLPELLGFLLATLSLLAGVSGDAFNLENPLAVNLGYFIGPSGSPVLRALLTPLDAITIWTLALTAIGIPSISKVKRGTAFAVVFGWSAVVMLARVALAAATS